jgi:hypothetical protein
VSDIADFLRARIAERRALAEAARHGGAGRWHQEDPDRYPGRVVDERDELVTFNVSAPTDEQAAHIAANDPESVIADCDAKLALIDELDAPDAPALTDAQLHARFAHPAWEYRVTEGPRKQWDDIDDPPRDENGNPEPGWERNTDAGRDGWERWDYTEESYWRRLRPDGPRPVHIPRGLRIMAQQFAGHPDHMGEEWAP